jgi:penicillin-binding protein 1A
MDFISKVGLFLKRHWHSFLGFLKPVIEFTNKSIIPFCRKYGQQYSHLKQVVKTKPTYQRVLFLMARVGFWIFVFLLAVNINFLWLFGKSPNLHDLNNPRMEIASELYSSDSVLIARYFDKDRTPVEYQEISPLLIKTLVATEDQRFYKHSGVDLRSSFSIFFYMAQGKKRGGSTITQQLVKNLYKTRTHYSRGLLGYVPVVRTIIYKTKECINALKIELFYSKEEILAMYLNTVDFGSNSFGIHTASKVFFNTSPGKLTATQCATLVGMLKAPTLYSPVQNPRNSLERRNTVLGQMLKQNIISKTGFDSLKKLPLGLHLNFNDDDEGNTGYFSNVVARYLKPWLKENGYNLYTDGLKIYTTVDSKLQQYAEEAVTGEMKRQQRNFEYYLGENDPWQDEKGQPIPGFIDDIVKRETFYKKLADKYNNNPDSISFYLNLKHRMKVFTWKGEQDTTFSHLDSLRYFNRFLHGALVSMDPFTGYVLSWIGDINYDYFKYDHVKQSKRQAGSTFKTFLYTAAIDNGHAPCDMMTDSPVTIEYTENGEQKTWAPQNVTCVFSGQSVSLKYAFARSINSIAVQLTKELGWRKVMEYAKKMGITSELADVPSVAIGSSDVSLFELVNAYSPIINGGYRVEPLIVTRIYDKEGKLIKEFTIQKTRVISEETAFLMVQMLRGGMTEPRATTQALFSYDLFRSKIEFGGKTGTSQNYSDGWFVGVTPKIIGGAWVGGEYRSVHFHSSSQGEGCHTALPIFGRYMEKVLKDSKYDYLKVPFPKPTQKITKYYTCHTVLPRDTVANDSVVIVDNF